MLLQELGDDYAGIFFSKNMAHRVGAATTGSASCLVDSLKGRKGAVCGKLQP
jgi:hypothetical protein